MFFYAILRPRFKLVEAPARSGDTDDRDVKMAPLRHCLQRGKDFFISQISRGTKKDEGIRLSCVHRLITSPVFPNGRRIQNASRREPCPGNQLLRVTQSAHTMPWSKPAPARPHQ